MTAITPELKLHVDQEDNGIHINFLIMRHRGNNYHIHASTKDTVHVFAESIALYVLTMNKYSGTIGLNAYMSPEASALNSFYLHSAKEIKGIFGPRWEQLPALDIVQKLVNYLI